MFSTLILLMGLGLVCSIEGSDPPVPKFADSYKCMEPSDFLMLR